MTRPVRLDTELVRRSLVSSREEARRAIERGIVKVNGLPATRAATLVAQDASVSLAGPPARFVSRGGEKLDRALGRLSVEVSSKRWLDAGASTGGFTDRLLQGGAAAVIAADVGYGQLDWRLRNDSRVMVLERTNVRTLDSSALPWMPDGVVADLSFISLTIVMPALVRVAAPHADFVLLVKPQFEVGRERVGKRGVVRNPNDWRAALGQVTASGADHDLGLMGAVVSELVGPAGNREFFLHLRQGATGSDAMLDGAVEEAS